MVEVWEFWSGLGPLGRAITFFPLGLSIGSFLSVVLHRLPMGGNPVRGRSHCTSCGTQLRMHEMVPILSFFLQHGRCRHCGAPISWRYPLFEVGAGLVGALGGALGWAQGLVLLLGMVGLAVMRGRRRSAQTGSMILEILIAVSLLVVVIIPMVNFSTIFRGGATYPRQLAASLASAKLEELENKSYRRSYESYLCQGLDPTTDPDFWPIAGNDPAPGGTFAFTRSWTVGSVSSTETEWPAEADHLRELTITVSCTNCRTPMVPVRMTVWIGKLEMEESGC